jgi:chitin disaccharide deacetylase
MKKLIVNADDLGYREEVNRGIIYAHKNGIVTSASLFVEREGTQDALRLIKENPSLGLGIHLDLDKFFTVDHTMGHVTGWITPEPSIDAVKLEIRRQLDKFISFGFKADHVDSHHHAHMIPNVFSAITEIMQDYGVRVIRYFDSFYTNNGDAEKVKKAIQERGLKTTDHFIEGWYWGNVDEQYEVAELMTHPGYGELWRESELAHCCQPQLKEYFGSQNIKLLKFSETF